MESLRRYYKIYQPEDYLIEGQGGGVYSEKSVQVIVKNAALKPQFKSKTKTAIIVSLLVWILANVIGNVANVVYGFMPVKITVIGIIWGLMEFLLATLVAARLYERNQKKDTQ
ncbi:MAG: hypothetical protein M0P40_08815 [Bacteroidales bacterium]|nr:hypothetical protein [Bacteroidales bacterium]MDD2264220.1 hypothetical protein [Bacteroidales bacterium]MDD2831454.1 hypothetical protein [Bacteroidales bacterium]MDD3208448.1 hypothetical protein [Bacteroidales bacterium]MDD3697139.1 hypothetical protein [Bacteroidales bacterium]